MRYLLLLVLLFLSFGHSVAQDAAPNATIEFTDHPARVVTNINALNMRSSPAIEADNIVGRLQPGQQVHVIARDGGWQQVRSENGLLGWSHSDYLIDMPPRQLGEARLFRIHDELADTRVLVEGELGHIGQHSYTYVTVHPELSSSVRPDELHTFAKAFDNKIFPETYALWAPDPKPSHEGDERIVILLSVGYQISSGIAGFYHGRGDMPGEPHPYGNRTGFLEIIWNRSTHPSFPNFVAAHELQHLTQHQFDNDEYSWVNEGLSNFTSGYVTFSVWDWGSIYTYLDEPYSQLNIAPELTCGEGPGLLFTTFILEQLGLEALRDFVRRPENGLAALDALFAERDSGLDTETFFADFVLANYLRNIQLADGRFGYQLFSSLPIPRPIPKPYVRGRIISLPTLMQESLPPYATDFYDFALPASGQPQQLELALQFPNSAAQDGWLQFVQVVEGEVILQRYRASEYRNQMIPATLHPDAEQAFLAISPFQANARHLTAKQPYILKIHPAGSDGGAADYASTESSYSPDNVTEPTKAIEQRSPVQLATEIDVILEKIIEDRNRIRAERAENRIGEYITQVEELIAAGAAVDGAIGASLLTKVVKRIQSPALLALFLENGADPNQGVKGTWISLPGIIGTYPANPLNYAVFYGDFASLELLIDAGAAVDNATLRLASTGGARNSVDTRIMSMLLADGTSSRITASGLRAAAEVARQRRHHAIAEILEAAAAKLN